MRAMSNNGPLVEKNTYTFFCEKNGQQLEAEKLQLDVAFCGNAVWVL